MKINISQFLIAAVFIGGICNIELNGRNLENQPPNIILVFVDDLGYGDLGCYGQELIKTPNIDRMAKEGIRFTDFYTGTPVCAPSRYNLMTGKHAGHSYIRSNLNELPLGQLPIKDDEIIIPELLKKAGYATAASGKWALGSPYNQGDPLKQGFDHFFGYYCQCYAHNYYPETLWRNKDTVKLKNETVPVKVNFIDYPLSYAVKKVEYSADYIFDEALDFIDKNMDRPFFLYYSSTLPHSNGEAPQHDRFEVPSWGIYENKDWLPYEKGYAAMVTMLDDQMGIIMKKLSDLGIARNTLVIFTSDNGPTKFAKIFNSAGELRGRKRDLYEGGIRVPFIAWWPTVIPKGVETSLPASTMDLLPTFCEIAGVDLPANIDGQSLLPTLTQTSEQSTEHLYWEFWEADRSPKQAVRKGDWKLLRFEFDNPERREVELYNLSEDMGESQNVAGSNPKIVKEMIEIMEKEHTPYPNAHMEAK
jgi:arylsulfatase A-like enzyme